MLARWAGTAVRTAAARGALQGTARGLMGTGLLREGAKAQEPPAAAAAGGPAGGGRKKKQKVVKRPRQRVYADLPAPPPPPKCIVAAHVVERLPQLVPLPEPWEEAMWELQERKDAAVRKPMPPEFFRGEMGGDGGEANELPKEEEEMIFAPRHTEADEANDIRSRRRALDRRLYLLTKGPDGKWGFPEAEWQQGEKMREAASRVLTDQCGQEFTVHPIGHCPMAYIDLGEGEAKRRTFFYYSQYIRGELELNQPKASDYVWVKREELHEYLPKEVTVITDDICDH